MVVLAVILEIVLSSIYGLLRMLNENIFDLFLTIESSSKNINRLVNTNGAIAAPLPNPSSFRPQKCNGDNASPKRIAKVLLNFIRSLLFANK